VRAVLLHGEGGSFTSGNDLGDFMQSPPTGENSPVLRFLSALSAFEKPIVAAVEGHAIGIGTTLLLHCDLVYAAPSARFQVPFVNLALVPEAASSLLLPRLAGHARAAELLFFGEPFDAATAHDLGIVSAVADDVLAHARARVSALVAKPAQALRLTKRLMKQPLADAVRAQMRAEGAVFIERLASAEVREAITAFFEKRPPNFR
jgi:enoyl-CoA hydratase/carnithine racemase